MLWKMYKAGTELSWTAFKTAEVGAKEMTKKLGQVILIFYEEGLRPAPGTAQGDDEGIRRSLADEMESELAEFRGPALELGREMGIEAPGAVR